MRSLVPFIAAALPLALLVGCTSSDSVDPRPALSAGGSGGVSAQEAGETSPPPVSSDGGLAIVPQCEAPTSGAKVWYVDVANGKDTNDGRSLATAFQTIGRAVSGSSSAIAPGDFVMIAGGVYRERVRITKSGTGAQRITLRPLDLEKEVVVDASDAVTGWKLVAGEVFAAHTGFPVQAVVVDGAPLFPVDKQPTEQGHYHYETTSSTLSVWIRGGGDPTGHTVGVVAVDEEKTQQAIEIAGASDITVCGITARFAGARGVLVWGDRVRVEYCRILFNGGTGMRVAPYDQIASVEAVLAHNEIAFNFLRNWPRCSNGYVYSGWGTGVSCEADQAQILSNVVHDNGGEGIVVGTSKQGARVESNVTYDNFSANIYALNTQNVTIQGNISYAQDPSLATLSPGLSDDEKSSCQKRLRPDGILTGDEGGTSSFDHALIANNILLNTRHAIGHVSEGTGSGIKNVKFVFNTIVTPSSPLDFENPIGISYPFNDGNNTGNVYKNNILIATHARALLLDASTDPAGGADAFLGLDISHNLFYSSSNAKPFHWGSSWESVFDHEGWAAVPGAAHGAGDVVADPKLKNPTSLDPASFCPADKASPALDQGVDVGVISDILGRARPLGPGWDLGACEYQP